MSAYLGINVLSTRPELGPRKYATLANILDNSVGARRADDRSGVSTQAQAVQFVATTRAGIDEIRTFLSTLRGRALPFWMPTWRTDFALHTSAAGGATSLRIHSCGYTANAYPLSHMRDIQLYTHSGVTQWRRITSAVDSGTGYETMGISALSSAISTTNCMVSYLGVYRLGSDTITTTWHSASVATISVDIIELPSEVPA